MFGIADRVANGKNLLEVAVDESLVDDDRPLRRLCIGLADLTAGDASVAMTVMAKPGEFRICRTA